MTFDRSGLREKLGKEMGRTPHCRLWRNLCYSARSYQFLEVCVTPDCSFHFGAKCRSLSCPAAPARR